MSILVLRVGKSRRIDNKERAVHAESVVDPYLPALSMEIYEVNHDACLGSTETEARIHYGRMVSPSSVVW